MPVFIICRLEKEEPQQLLTGSQHEHLFPATKTESSRHDDNSKRNK